MDRPLVAIVGRPNVGKSTFFNKVVGKRISIVKDEPGVTRDRIYGDAEWCGTAFSLIDTGGLNFGAKDDFNDNIIEQVKIAVDLAEVIIFFVDGKDGITTSDYDVAEYLRKSNKKVVLAVNKIDNNEIEKSFEFYALNFGVPFVVSAEHGKGLGDLLDEVVTALRTRVPVGIINDNRIKIAVIGKPNAGKSSLINALLNKNRMVVSPIAGTTRDAIDEIFDYNGEEFILIDTAGIRRKSQISSDSIESYSVLRALESVKRADVVILVIDATAGITDQDQKIASFAHGEGKPSIFVVNKWDIVSKDTNTMNEFVKNINLDFAFMGYQKVVFLSAKTGEKLTHLMPAVKQVFENSNRQISMGVLNDIMGDAISMNPPPSKSGKRPRISHCTQVAVRPPKFIFFCTDSENISTSYARYLENKLRGAFDFEGTPITLYFRDKNEKEV